MASSNQGASEHVHLPLTREQQQALTAGDVLVDLMAGNRRFVEGKTRSPGGIERRAAATGGQFPKAVVLSCLDSRVPVEQVFDQGIGDLFVGRVAGNVEDADQLGSMEFAVASGVKIVMVLGHSGCGAVRGAIDLEDPGKGFRPGGNLKRLLEKIRPAVRAVDEPGARTADNEIFWRQVVEENVRQTVARIRRGSPALARAERDAAIRIAGAVYDLETGSVQLLSAEDQEAGRGDEPGRRERAAAN